MHRHPVLSAFALAALALVGAAAVGFSHRDTAAQDATPAVAAEGIVGSWMVTAQLADGFSFVNVTTVMPGGVLINTSDDGPAGHGAWARTGDGAYAFTFVAPDFDDDGSLEGLVTVRAEATLGADGDTFAGPFATEVTDPTGTVLFAYAGTVEATRIAVEPLPAATPTP